MGPARTRAGVPATVIVLALGCVREGVCFACNDDFCYDILELLLTVRHDTYRSATILCKCILEGSLLRRGRQCS